MPYIIAEIGSNWRDKSDILRSVQIVAAAGAHAFKMQFFTQNDLYGYVPPAHKLPIMRELKAEYLPVIRQECDKHKVDFILSCFHPSKIKVVDPFVTCHKLASSEVSNWPLHEAIALSKKKIIISTGAASQDEIAELVDRFDKRIRALLYCAAAYPPRYLDLRNIRIMRTLFPQCDIGFSDHTTDVLGTPLVAATEFGCEIFEKHVNCVACTEEESADAPHSLRPQELAEMIEAITYRSRTRVLRTVHVDEKEFARVARRKVVATKNIYTGTRLVLGHNCELARPLRSWDGVALLPEDMSDVFQTLNKIDVGSVISKNDVERVRV
jgi:sialic acid synthase SpsE